MDTSSLNKRQSKLAGDSPFPSLGYRMVGRYSGRVANPNSKRAKSEPCVTPDHDFGGVRNNQPQIAQRTIETLRVESHLLSSDVLALPHQGEDLRVNPALR